MISSVSRMEQRVFSFLSLFFFFFSSKQTGSKIDYPGLSIRRLVPEETRSRKGGGEKGGGGEGYTA